MKKVIKIIISMLIVLSQLAFVAGCGGKKEKILHEVYADNFMVGFATSSTRLNMMEYQPIFKHFNSMTAENEMKWAYMRPNAYATDYRNADKFINKAKELGIKMRGHALVWHHASAVPSYLQPTMSKESLLSSIETHVKETIDYFGDEVIYAWDVVNEAITDNNNSGSIYRGSSDSSGDPSFFYDVAEEEYIYTAFRAAQEIVDEKGYNIKLFYNDYGMTNSSKRARVIKMIRDIKAQGIRVDGIGMQGHYNMYTYKASEFRNAIEDFIAEGLEVHITELDISVHQNDDSRAAEFTKEMEEIQARTYKSIFEICLEYEEVTSVTTWGVADDYTWLDNHPVKNRKNWPLLFNENFGAKEALNYILNLKD